MGGGQYVVDMAPAFESLALACIENVITERFGSKASRIFRVVRMRKYIEQEELQKEAMIPAKEAKLLSYSLFQEQFLQVKTIRKAGGGGTGPAKAFYLFYLKNKQVRYVYILFFRKPIKIRKYFRLQKCCWISVSKHCTMILHAPITRKMSTNV